jgi:hypothetical protein
MVIPHKFAGVDLFLINPVYQTMADSVGDRLPFGSATEYCSAGPKKNGGCAGLPAYRNTVNRWNKGQNVSAKQRRAADLFLRDMIKQNHPQAYADLSACLLSHMCSDEEMGVRALEAETLLLDGLAKHPEHPYLQQQMATFRNDTPLMTALWFTRIQQGIDGFVGKLFT